MVSVPARLREVKGDAVDLKDRLMDQARTVDRRFRSVVEDHPVAAVVGAVAVGYLLARLLRR